MNFSEAFKVFQLNILRQAGVAVTPDQLGLKRDPIADLQAKSASSAFDNILGKTAGAGSAGFGTPPAPPTPPADPTDAAAQSKYQQELLAYQQSLQAYNQRFMQLMLQQFNMLQQRMLAQQKEQSKSESTASLDGPVSTGGILEIF